MKEWVGLLARLVTGCVWIVAGAAKVLDPAESVAAVRAYQLLPGNLAEPVGQLLPVLEIVVGATLVLGLLTRGSAVVSALLFIAFIIGIASVWARGISIDCGCFGGGGYDADAASKYPWEIARDAVLLLASLFVAWLPSTRLALDAALFGRAGGRAPEPEGS
ncbi:MauE/DoxX family redox-associated membrane protein [Nocardioides sp.]|uniref:MauE/DoxX family redox-associated membrane protein n=1 Tax=Nocardioides sp. TaxID=35761 RepID=UPI002ED96581